ncbi:putative Stigma-specific Stig1 family protein [Tripterygium wilfordii]|uniref:Putative Stigma-specific Stig1 family protein n=1 Tax=Tripterygium wilfordii TaxID=458696 RepID=A0A7J7C4K4_TRIWF|nr:stigma-specific STIG1-like protein 1 [Tripterygium wilfordii]KAF5729080.1 putative Stigma-specific Stig1 family protein [Tripterygium wilfordii]
MKYNTLIRILLLVLAMLAIALQASPHDQQPFLEDDDDTASGHQEHISLGRFLRQRVPMKCNKNPRICRAEGSPGRDCCKKKCVNVKTDRHNCGMCGKKCKYSEICCKGKCVKPMYDKKHCGGCNNKCNKGSACVYGMCSYA